MKTTAAILVELGAPLEVDEITIPAMKTGQVLVEIAYSGACHTQVMETRGLRGPDKFLPHCLGHEASGIVIDIGENVHKVAAGDRVVLSWIKGSGTSVPGTVYKWGGRDVNAGGVTTFMRHALISEDRLTRLADSITMDAAVMMGCALPTGTGAVLNVLQPRPGQSVAVFGVGGVGLCAVMAAAAISCHPIIAVDPNPKRRALAMTLGASHTIAAGAADAVAEIAEITGGGADFAVEASGKPAAMRQALASVRQQGGRAVVIGNAPAGEVVEIDPRMFNDGRSLMGTWGGDTMPDRDFPRLMSMLTSGALDPTPLLSNTYGLHDINAALDDLAAGDVGRPLIDMAD